MKMVMGRSFLVGAIVVAGCASKPTEGARPPSAGEGVLVVDAGAEPATGNAAGRAGTCVGDANCRLVRSYCRERPCGCEALGVGGEATCAGPATVQCLVDPCRAKVAHCRAGACVVDDDRPEH